MGIIGVLALREEYESNERKLPIPTDLDTNVQRENLETKWDPGMLRLLA